MLGFRDKNRPAPEPDEGVARLDGLGPLERSADGPLPAVYTRRPSITWGRRTRSGKASKRGQRDGDGAGHGRRATTPRG